MDITASQKLRHFMAFSRNVETVIFGPFICLTIKPVQKEIPLFEGDELDLEELLNKYQENCYLIGERYIVQQTPQDDHLEVKVVFHAEQDKNIDICEANCILASLDIGFLLNKSG